MHMFKRFLGIDACLFKSNFKRYFSRRRKLVKYISSIDEDSDLGKFSEHALVQDRPDYTLNLIDELTKKDRLSKKFSILKRKYLR